MVSMDLPNCTVGRGTMSTISESHFFCLKKKKKKFRIQTLHYECKRRGRSRTVGKKKKKRNSTFVKSEMCDIFWALGLSGPLGTLFMPSAKCLASVWPKLGPNKTVRLKMLQAKWAKIKPFPRFFCSAPNEKGERIHSITSTPHHKPNQMKLFFWCTPWFAYFTKHWTHLETFLST